ncbi:MAG: acyltransferase [Bacteroidales bacterium]|nr:acyltransferase [Bacteroidales bacterium]
MNLNLIKRLSPFRIRRKIQKRINDIYLHWLKKQFAHFGKDSFVSHIRNLTGAEYISVGDNVRFGQYCVLEAFALHKNPEITIGDNSLVGDFCHLGSIDYIHIGKNVIIGRFVLINDHSHGSSEDRFSDIPPLQRKLFSKGGITIGDNVWIGDKVSILSGVNIGKGAIVGTNSVVTKDIPSYAIAAGCPARIIQDGDSNSHTEL